ncbi:membrane protein [soil metagenome]
MNVIPQTTDHASRPALTRLDSQTRLNPVWHIDLRLLVAVLAALVYHGVLSVYGTYRNTYDAYVHIFFADHWTRGWFDHWDPRWYTGFTLTSYPPLSQQSVAAVSFLTGDLRLSFALVQTTAMVVMTIGMYRFAQLWVSKEAAGWAAIWLVFSSAMAETIHVFGQLPTTYSLALLLNALPFAYLWIVRGKFSDLAKAWALVAATTGAHHVTTLFGSVFITAPVLVLALVERFRTIQPGEPLQHPRYITGQNSRALVMRRLRRVLGPLVRCGVFGVGTIVLLIIVVLPYWAWSRGDPITQVTIPHASRDNFLVNLNAGLVFWLIPYGVLLFAFPYVFYKGLSTKAWPLACSIALLALLGTGGTTPIPKLLLGGAFNILTLDRFTLWASILMLPLAGEFFVSLRNGNLARWLQAQFGLLMQRAILVFLVLGLLIASVFTVNLTQFRRFQPAPIDMQPIVNFLQKDQHSRWRYMTLGFGDQMAWLSAQTTATQVDGNYHSARRLPEMTTTPVERLEGAKFSGIPGIGSLQQFLNVPDKYNLKYIFSNDQFYDPLLFFDGWHRLQFLENGIAVWEREDTPVLPEVLPRREIPRYQRLMFGILPPLALILSVIAVTAVYWQIPFLLLGEALGTRPYFERFYLRLSRPFHKFWQAIDKRMLDASHLTDAKQGRAPRWQLYLRLFVRRSRRRMRTPTPTARHVRMALLSFTLLLSLILIGWRVAAFFTNPIYLITSYYDNLDFRRFESAYQQLDPATRPDFEQYLLNLSLRGGLVASYSKLDSLKTTVLQSDATQMQVRVDTRYITALSYYTDTQVLALTNNAGAGWRIEPEIVDIRVPPGQFIRRPSVTWLSQGRGRVANNVGDFVETLDRPELQVLSARLVSRPNGRFSVVGELMNIDVDPADVTVSAYIYDEQDKLLTSYNAGAGMMHKLFPLEITPFRVDFEGVAGLALKNAKEPVVFSPGSTWDYTLPNDKKLGRYAVFAKAVVTQRDLNREVGAQDLTVKETDKGLNLQGVLVNAGLKEAVIPHLLVTLYDEQGRVLWVDHFFISNSLRPQRTMNFSVNLTPSSTIGVLDVKGDNYSNAPATTPGLVGPRQDFLTLPISSGYRYLRVSVHYFTGDSN